MKLHKHLLNADTYEWLLDIDRYYFTFSDDLETLYVEFRKSPITQTYHAYKNDSTDEIYYDWSQTSAKASANADTNVQEDALSDEMWIVVNQVAKLHFIAKERYLWDEYVDPDGHTTDEEWESGTVADRILLMDKCSMLEVVDLVPQ